MSSYHSKFTYLNKNSKDDLGWIIVHFDPDSGETDSYLSQEQVYTDLYNGSRRILYGTKWNEVVLIKITVIKQDGGSFSLSECRNAYRWLTGNPNASWLDLYAGDTDEIKYSFLCTVQGVKPQKLDSRTVGLNIYFESVSPWAYSPIQTVTCSIEEKLTIDEDGVLSADNQYVVFSVDENGVLHNSNTEQPNITDDGTVYFNYTYITEYTSDSTVTGSDDSSVITIDNQSDDLYTYVYLDTVFINTISDYLSIKNITLDEETIITGLAINEKVTLSSGQFIISDKPNKIFGDTFNFVWPRLGPGINEFAISTSSEGTIQFKYRYPIKIGDCAIDVDVSGGGIDVCE